MLSKIRRLMKAMHPEGIPWPGSVFYNMLSSTVMFQHHYELVVRDILSYCKEGNLLDVGTGPGRLLLKLSQQAPQMQLAGIDSSPAMVVKAKKNMVNAGLIKTIEIKQGNANRIPFAETSFDIVVSTASIHHWKEPIQGLNEVYRVLKKGGYGLIYDLVSDTPKPILKDCKQKFGWLKSTLFWLHSFEEPFFSQQNFEELVKPTLFKECQGQFVGLLYCLIMKKS